MKRKIIVTGIITIVILITAVNLTAYIFAYKSLHMPRQPILKTPEDYGLKYEDIEFKSTDNLSLKGWWIPGNSNTVIIVSHGYSANRSGWKGKDKKGNDEYLDWLSAAVPLNEKGYHMIYFDHRGCGKSDGELTTLGKDETRDLMGAVNWMLKNKAEKHSIDRIGLMGFSMGGNVVLRSGIELKKMIQSDRLKAVAVIAIGPYMFDTMIDKSIRYWTSLPSFFIPLFKRACGWVLGFNASEEINPQKYVNKISPVPVLYIQADKDDIGDVSDVKKMFTATGEPKDIIIIRDAPRFDQYKYPAEKPARILEFYNKHLTNK